MTFSEPDDDPRFKMKLHRTLHNKTPFHQPLRKRKMFQLNLQYQHQRWLHTHFHILKKLFDINYGCHIIFLHIECNLRPIPLTGSWTWAIRCTFLSHQHTISPPAAGRLTMQILLMIVTTHLCTNTELWSISMSAREIWRH